MPGFLIAHKLAFGLVLAGIAAFLIHRHSSTGSAVDAGVPVDPYSSTPPAKVQSASPPILVGAGGVGGGTAYDTGSDGGGFAAEAAPADALASVGTAPTVAAPQPAPSNTGYVSSIPNAGFVATSSPDQAYFTSASYGGYAPALDTSYGTPAPTPYYHPETGTLTIGKLVAA